MYDKTHHFYVSVIDVIIIFIANINGILIKKSALFVGPCHHGMAQLQAADEGSPDMEGSCEYIE
jgi:hypothetical protein